MKVKYQEYEKFYKDDDWFFNSVYGYIDWEEYSIGTEIVYEFFEDVPSDDLSKVLTFDGGVALKEVSLSSVFKQWKKQQSTIDLIVNVNKELVDAIKLEIKEIVGVKSVK